MGLSGLLAPNSLNRPKHEKILHQKIGLLEQNQNSPNRPNAIIKSNNMPKKKNLTQNIDPKQNLHKSSVKPSN